MYNAASKLFALKSDEEWLEILIRSIYEPVIDGIEMPRFPHGSIQRQFVGSADEHALREGFAFYQYVKGYAAALGMPLHAGTRVLDFGSGWGRYTRILWNDVDANNIHGVDIDPDMISISRATGVPGHYTRIEPRGSLPFDDGHFDCIISYSVFSHLPEAVAEHWMSELSRVAKSGCVFAYTTEPRRFLDFILDIPAPAPSDWHAGLAEHKPLIPKKMQEFDEGKFVYLPTSGGEHRSADVYGDACIPVTHIRENWSKYFETIAYIDDSEKFWQAFVVSQKK